MAVCNKCIREIDEENFYLSKNGLRMKTCKKCYTMHVNVREPSTFYHILKDIDIPFMPAEWDTLVDRYAADPRKSKASTVVGRYISKMKLNQYASYNFEDTERLIADYNTKAQKAKEEEEALIKQYAKATGMAEEDMPEWLEKNGFADAEDGKMNLFDFSREERRRLTLKWGGLYKPEEWTVLEDFYNRMKETYEINGASHEDYLKKICKTSLKMDQAIDIGDIQGFSQLSKGYDMLMKSAKFTAVQNKTESSNFIDSIGEMVRICESEGFIPRFHTEEEKDIVDVTLKDMSIYLERLVKNELNLGSLIESAAKTMQMQAEEDEADENNLEEYVLKDEDYMESDILHSTEEEEDSDVSD